MNRFTQATVLATVVLVIVAILLARRPLPDDASDPSSPAQAVRAYLVAREAGRADQAWTMLATRAQSRETRDDFLRRHAWVPNGRGPQYRIVATAIEEDEARVTVTRNPASRPNFAVFPGDPAPERFIVTLVREDAVWRLLTPPDDL